MENSHGKLLWGSPGWPRPWRRRRVAPGRRPSGWLRRVGHRLCVSTGPSSVMVKNDGKMGDKHFEMT